MNAARNILLAVFFLAVLPVSARDDASAPSPSFARQEQVRSNCVAGRRHICGRVLQVTKAGLVVDSGYTVLLQAPFDHAWVNRAVANLPKPAAQLERNAADSVAVGLVCLTDFPKRPKVRPYDYVAIIGYPAGQYDYVPAPGVKKTIRRFTGGLERAVTLTLQSGEH